MGFNIHDQAHVHRSDSCGGVGVSEALGGLIGGIVGLLLCAAFALGGDYARDRALKCIDQLTISHAEFCLGKEKP